MFTTNQNHLSHANMVIILFALISLIILYLILPISSNFASSTNNDGLLEPNYVNSDALICRKRGTSLESSLIKESLVENPHIVVIGDIHGSYDGLLEDLYYSNITAGRYTCEWRKHLKPVILIQMGDLVDRGPQALESFICLRNLQNTAVDGNKVVRLLGNHELFWLEGYYRDRNITADSPERIRACVDIINEDVLSGNIVAAYLHYLPNYVPVIFVHAGYSRNFQKFIRKELKKSNMLLDGEKLSPTKIVEYTNNILLTSMKLCEGQFPCIKPLQHEVFGAGPDRGGRGIGGPFWTDFDGMEASLSTSTSKPSFLQVVGHTMAFCYHPKLFNIHPPDTQFECSRGLVRGTPDLSVTCVDGGMYVGARAFMIIDDRGHFIAYERRSKEGESDWKSSDLTKKVCESNISESDL